MRLVTVAVYPHSHQAHLARALLNDAGISSFIANEYGVVLPFFSPTDDGVRVQVPEDAAEEARAVLRAADDAAGPTIRG